MKFYLCHANDFPFTAHSELEQKRLQELKARPDECCAFVIVSSNEVNNTIRSICEELEAKHSNKSPREKIIKDFIMMSSGNSFVVTYIPGANNFGFFFDEEYKEDVLQELKKLGADVVTKLPSEAEISIAASNQVSSTVSPALLESDSNENFTLREAVSTLSY